MKILDFFSYALIRMLTFPIRFMPYAWIHRFGNTLGRIAFHLIPNYRKRALSNLALAKSLGFSNEQILETAKQTFGNLAINCLEYAKLGADDQLLKTIECKNPEILKKLHSKGQGSIFFCAHQANWEVLFLYGTLFMKGVAIGKEIKNKRLYNWIISIREKNGGKIISVKNGIREGLRALKSGAFLGIVGDQSTAGSGYQSHFFGRPAWTSSAPALLAYKTNCPIIFAETRRSNGKYQIHFSDPIWPDLTKPVEEQVSRMMNETLCLLEESIKKQPDQWLWQHNRWKQQSVQKILRQFRYDSICIMLPSDPKDFAQINAHLPTLKEIYPTETFFLFTHRQNLPSIEAEEVFYYDHPSELLREDYRFKLIFNFTNNQKIKTHYLNLSAFKVLSLTDLTRLAMPHLQAEYTLSDIIKRAICPI
jgi:KDO2-lipid IV(A) lauroyltransferase